MLKAHCTFADVARMQVWLWKI